MRIFMFCRSVFWEVTFVTCWVTMLPFSCREVNPSARRSTVKQNISQAETSSSFDTIALFATIVFLEDAIFTNPHDTLLRRRLMKYCLDTVSGCFYTVGKATYNPDFPQNLRRQSMQTAASAVAKRWALYLKAWSHSATLPFGGFIEGDVVYSQVLYEVERGDTMWQMLKIPIGSIIIR